MIGIVFNDSAPPKSFLAVPKRVEVWNRNG